MFEPSDNEDIGSDSFSNDSFGDFEDLKFAANKLDALKFEVKDIQGSDSFSDFSDDDDDELNLPIFNIAKKDDSKTESKKIATSPPVSYFFIVVLNLTSYRSSCWRMKMRKTT